MVSYFACRPVLLMLATRFGKGSVQSLGHAIDPHQPATDGRLGPTHAIIDGLSSPLGTVTRKMPQVEQTQRTIT